MILIYILSHTHVWVRVVTNISLFRFSDFFSVFASMLCLPVLITCQWINCISWRDCFEEVWERARVSSGGAGFHLSQAFLVNDALPASLADPLLWVVLCLWLLGAKLNQGRLFSVCTTSHWSVQIVMQAEHLGGAPLGGRSCRLLSAHPNGFHFLTFV